MSRVSVDLNTGTATIDGADIELTPKDAELLYLLTRTVGKTYARQEIIHRLWGFQAELQDETGAIRQRVHTLRQKLRETSLRIEAKWGYGYKAVLEDT
jgi:DNA-binding response OmpR family regulator